MKSIKYDKNKAEEEQIAKEKVILRNQKREEYLEKLKEDKRFQEYVIEDILKKQISELTDTRLIRRAYEKAGGDISRKEELGDVVLQSIQASIKLEQILSALLN